MAILSTEAIVLSDMAQGDTSKIIRVLTKDYGKVSLIAKGSRKLKNRFGGCLDVLNHVSLVYYHKENRDLHTVTQCDVHNAFPGIKSTLDKLAFAYSMIELLVRLIFEEERDPALFSLVVQSLSALESRDKNFENVYWYFLSGFVRVSGFALNVEQCQGCGGAVDARSSSFSAVKGGMLCEHCSHPEPILKLSAEAVQVLKNIVKKEPDTLNNLYVSHAAKQELNALFDTYFRYHFEGYTTPKAVTMLMNNG